MATLPADTWLRLAAWMAIGLAPYVVWGRRHGALRAARVADGAPASRT